VKQRKKEQKRKKNEPHLLFASLHIFEGLRYHSNRVFRIYLLLGGISSDIGIALVTAASVALCLCLCLVAGLNDFLVSFAYTLHIQVMLPCYVN
jgi:hypothetical protein